MFDSTNEAHSLNLGLTQGDIEALLQWGNVDQQLTYIAILHDFSPVNGSAS